MTSQIALLENFDIILDHAKSLDIEGSDLVARTVTRLRAKGIEVLSVDTPDGTDAWTGENFIHCMKPRSRNINRRIVLIEIEISAENLKGMIRIDQSVDLRDPATIYNFRDATGAKAVGVAGKQQREIKRYLGWR